MRPTTNFELLKYRIYSTVVADILKAIDGGSNGGAFILSFCCIDYFSTPHSLLQKKKGADKKDFKSFIQKYLSQANPSYSNLGDELYAIRCSLVHTYGESEATSKTQVIPNFQYGTCLEDIHLRLENGKLTISLSDLISELIIAIEVFFYENRNSSELEEWLKKLYYPQNLKATIDLRNIKEGGRIEYKFIHPTLETLENINSLDIIKSDLKDKIKDRIETAMKL